MREPEKQKPIKAVFAGFDQDPTAEDVAEIHKALTGKDSTPQEIAEMQRILDEPTA